MMARPDLQGSGRVWRGARAWRVSRQFKRLVLMSYENFVGLRYLMAKKRTGSVVSIITLISVFGVALGVTALIVVLSVMGGFKKDLKQKILGAKAHIVVKASDDALIPDATSLLTQVRAVAGVTGAAPYTEHEVMVSSASGLSGVMLRGIDLASVGDVSELPRSMRQGELQYLVDDGPLMKQLRASRDAELDELLERLRREQDEIKVARGEVEPGQGVATSAGEPDEPSSVEVLPTPAPLIAPGEAVGLGKIVAPAVTQAVVSPSLPEADDIPELPGDEDGEVPPLPGDEPASDPSVAPQAAARIPGLLIGPELAKSLQVSLGDEVNVVTPNGELGPMGRLPRSRPFRVVGIFYSGMYEYDANYAYTQLEDAQRLMDMRGVMGVELKTVDVDRAVGIAATIEAELGAGYEVLDWMALNSSLFYALKLEKISMFVVLTFIILVASFSIVAMLIMIVIEKGREIAVLKALGASDVGVMQIFVLQGTVIGTVGTVLGLGMGVVICYLLETVGFPLNSEVYYISTLPVDLDIVEVLLVVVCAIGISMLATIYPSLQAARLKPVDGLRDE